MYHTLPTFAEAPQALSAQPRAHFVAKPYCPTLMGGVWPALYVVFVPA